MIGGMSWVSTAMYYEQINKAVAKREGGLSSAPLLVESHDFAAVAARQHSGDWDGLGAILAASARRLAHAGAEGLILCSNTAHKMYDRIADEAGIPVLHIGDITAAKLVKDGIKRAGLIGTRATMAESFYRDRIEAHGIAVATPDQGMMNEIDRIIFAELARGHVSRVSQRTLKTCLTLLSQARQQGVILACTELAMLVDPVANVLPVYDTTALHAQAAAEWILAGRASQRFDHRDAAAA